MSETPQNNSEVSTKQESTSEIKPVQVGTPQKVTKSLIIQTNFQNRSKSPVLSPRDGTKRPGSPSLAKSKVETVKKLMDKEIDKFNDFKGAIAGLQDRKEKLLEIIEQKQKQSIQINQNQELNTVTIMLQSQLNEQIKEKENILTKITIKKKEFENQLAFENQEKDRLNKDLQDKQQSFQKADIKELQNLKKQILDQQEDINQFSSEIVNSVNIKNNIQDQILAERKRKESLEAVNLKSQENNKKASSQEQKKKNDLILKIDQLKKQLQKKRQQAEKTPLCSKETGTGKLGAIQHEISKFKHQNEVLKNQKKHIDLEQHKKNKNLIDLRDIQKKYNQQINDIKHSSSKLQQKIVKQHQSIEEKTNKKEEKPQKWEQKVPEELLALNSKNDTLRKQARKWAEKCQAEVQNMEHLVPPFVIDTMNHRITQSINYNEKAVEIKNQIKQFTKENKILDEEKTQLEWGQNAIITELDIQRNKQQEKNKSIEEQLATFKKKHQQVNSKLDEFVKHYPDFNPEKKKKSNVKVEIKSGKSEQKKVQEKKNMVDSNIHRSVSNNLQSTEVKSDLKKNKKRKKQESPDNQVVQEKVKQEQFIEKQVSPLMKEEKKQTSASSQNQPKKTKKKKR